MTNDFVHLHVHTQYSLLDGFARIDKVIEKAKSMNMKAIAITDHGSMFGVIDFYKKAIKEGIKPIIGCEVYTAPRKLTDKDPGLDKYQGHLVLLAKNMQGYQNLIKLVSKAYVEGFYYKPRVDFDELEKYSEGLIALSACLGGDVQKCIMNRNYEKAKETALRLNQIFGQDNFYLELQDHGIKEQQSVNLALLKMSKELNIPLVATNDIHYVEKRDAKFHDILLCIQTGKTFKDESRMKFQTEEFYLKSKEEMESLFPNVPSAFENTVKIADRCNVDFDFNQIHLPQYDVPSGYTTNEYLRKLCFDGLNERYESISDDIRTRMEYELDVIEKMGYVEYFLIVWDFINFAKQNNIIVGPGRGSAAGSIVAYTLKITDIDPMKYGLLFERFLNPERVSMPDIDIDFCYERREEVIEYVKQKYGSDHVAQIITFGTLGAKAAIRDVGRVLSVEYQDVDKIAKEIPFALGMTIDKALDMNPTLRQMYDENENTKEIIDISRELEGMPRHASTHAAGVVIAKEPVENYVPLYMHENSISTQFTMTTLEELGLLKMDFLGLRTLTVIMYALENIKRSSNVDINFSKMDYDDKKVYELLSSGNTTGVFQLESSGMKAFMRELKPDNFEDIVAGISLFRPGPMAEIPRYIKNKRNPDNAIYIAKELEPILNVTYGVMVYQEQVMEIVRKLAGYSLGRSDLVRRAMSKKKHDVMEQERKNFIHGIVDESGNIVVPGCVRNGISESDASKIFDQMMDFASYAFNKSHAAAYAVLGYETAYLKAHYPVEFMSALITSVRGNTDKVVEYIRECSELSIQVLKPDINKSFATFAVEGNNIRYALSAIKNVGVGVIENIVKERQENGDFIDFIDFCNRLQGKDLNKRVVEGLIKSGAFDEISENRASLIAGYEKVLDSIQSDRKKNINGQLSLFDIGTSSEKEVYSLPIVNEFSDKEKLMLEKEAIGLYISGHPLSEYKEELRLNTSINMGIINQTKEDYEKCMMLDNKEVIMGGIIVSKNVKNTRNNSMMAFVNMQDLYSNIEIIVFPKLFKTYNHLLNEDNLIYVKGRLSVKDDEDIKLIASSFEIMQKIDDKKLYVKIEKMSDTVILSKIKNVSNRYSGNSIVCLVTDERRVYKMNEMIDINEESLKLMKSIVGDENVKIK